MVNNNEYVVFYERDKNDKWSLTDTPIFAISFEKGAISIVGDKAGRDTYAKYFQNDGIWKMYHLKSGYPLSSMLGSNPYSPIRFLTGPDAKTQFAKAVSKIEGGTTTIGRGDYSKVKVVKNNEV